MIDNAIKQFIQLQRSATVCCTDDEGHPYCFTCFYAFCAEEGLLFFKTSRNTHHAQMMLQRTFLSGTILPDELNPLLVKGVQWTGHLLPENDPLAAYSAVKYHKRFPFAMAMHGDVYTIQLDWIKMTDSSKVFAKKTVWRKNESTPQMA
jgi:uncharacterized protein